MTSPPVLVSLDPTRLREQLQSDPTLQALLARGYTVGTSCVLVTGAEGPEQTAQLALVLVPPPPAMPAAVVVPQWVAWWAGGMLGCTLLLVALAILAAVR